MQAQICDINCGENISQVVLDWQKKPIPFQCNSDISFGICGLKRQLVVDLTNSEAIQWLKDQQSSGNKDDFVLHSFLTKKQTIDYDDWLDQTPAILDVLESNYQI